MTPHLADAVFWIAVACCSIAQLAILRSVIRSPAQSSSHESSFMRRAGEIAWAVLPGIALAAVFVATWHAIHTPPRAVPSAVGQSLTDLSTFTGLARLTVLL